MSEPSQPPRSPKGRWLALAFALALAGFTFLCWRDASRPPVRPVSGGTFVGRDVDGRLVQVSLFESNFAEPGWSGWLFRDGREQTEWFSTTNRSHPWHGKVTTREREDPPTLPEVIDASTDAPLRLNATLPRTNGWASDTANLTREFEHLSFRRLTGLRLGRWGGTLAFHAQFPQLPGGSEFHRAVEREVIRQCEVAAAAFTSAPLDFWRENWALKEPAILNTHELTAHWQLRLLTANLVSFCVWSHDEVGGNGNHSQWRGANFIATQRGVAELELAELLRPEVNWQVELRQRCVLKLAAISAPRPEAVLDEDVALNTFTLSPTGLQIYFNPYEIASGADGEFVIHFDYAELKDLLRTEGPAAFLPRAP